MWPIMIQSSWWFWDRQTQIRASSLKVEGTKTKPIVCTIHQWRTFHMGAKKDFCCMPHGCVYKYWHSIEANHLLLLLEIRGDGKNQPVSFNRRRRNFLMFQSVWSTIWGPLYTHKTVMFSEYCKSGNSWKIKACTCITLQSHTIHVVT